MATPHDSRLDRETERLLSRSPLRAAPDFTAVTLARIRDAALAEPSPDDAALVARPLGVTPDFTARMFAAIAAERRRTRVIRFSAFATAAACLALAALVAIRAPRHDADTRLARVLDADAELAALASLPADSVATADLASLAELDDALAGMDRARES